MTTSDKVDRVFVWTWLPGRSEPVVAGAVQRAGTRFIFNYASSYLARDDRISLYTPELPLRSGSIEPLSELDLAGCLRDGTPDAWGRRVIESELGVEEESLSELEYMLQSGSNRFGALDFQESPTKYRPRNDNASLDELHEAAQRLQAGIPLSASMDSALLHGTSIGGARPKVLVEDEHGIQWIAKLSSTSDQVFSVINAEGAAMELSRRAGIETSHTEVSESLGRDILLVRRFDRTRDGGRHHAVSALTMSGEGEMGARYVTYPSVLEALREYSPEPAETAHALFERIAFNIAVGNSDDHARNHAAFWNGKSLSLTPAYDLAPGGRTGDSATQAMAFDPDGKVKVSNFQALVECAKHYDLNESDARASVDHIVESIRDNWVEVADLARVNQKDREHLWGRQFLNPAAFYDYSTHKATGRSKSGGIRRKDRGIPGNGGKFAHQERTESSEPLADPTL